MGMTEDQLSRIHREFREECIRLGTYRPITDAEIAKEEARWKTECQRPPKLPDRPRRRSQKK